MSKDTWAQEACLAAARISSAQARQLLYHLYILHIQCTVSLVVFQAFGMCGKSRRAFATPDCLWGWDEDGGEAENATLS